MDDTTTPHFQCFFSKFWSPFFCHHHLIVQSYILWAHFSALILCAHALGFQDGEWGDLLWCLVGEGGWGRKGRLRQQQEDVVQSVLLERGQWGDRSGRVEASGRRGAAHNGSHTQVPFWWKVGVFGSPLLATMSTCAGATLVFMRPRGWAKPGLPGSCAIGLDPRFWGDVSTSCGVSFISSILPWWREGRRTVGNKQEAKFRQLQAGHPRELCARNCWAPRGSQELSQQQQCETASTGQEKGWSHRQVLEGARVKCVGRKWSAGMGHFVGAHPLLAQGGGWWSCLHPSHSGMWLTF